MTSVLGQRNVVEGRSGMWLDYRAVWRWHFYAGLFSIPFVIWLATTGSIFLFKPQIERWLDRPYDRLVISGPRATPEDEVKAAIAVVPGSSLHYYELPTGERSAARVIVGRDADEFRVYVHPATLQVLNVVSEDARPMKVVSRLHGELLMGDRGSMIVELAASWAVVLLLTGIYLWWPRTVERLAGVVYVRLRHGQRIFWRDLHAVTGVWISAFTMFLLLTGLPWAKSWGGYLKAARSLGGAAMVRQGWTTGRSSELQQRMAMNVGSMEAMSGEHAGHMAHMSHSMAGMAMGVDGYAPLNRMVPQVARLGLAYPVLISPPAKAGALWTAKSDAQNRTLRTNLTLDTRTGAVTKRENFGSKSLVDRVVGFGVAAHEGQLFGIMNQLLELMTAIGLVLLSVSAVVMWWRRRSAGVLGAPAVGRGQAATVGLVATVLLLGVYLPIMGLSLVLVLLTERLFLSRMPGVSRWLGLRTNVV